MQLLTSTTDKLQVITDAAVAVSVHASWVDDNAGAVTPGRQNTLITTATTTDVVPAPGASIQRGVQTLNLVNTGASNVGITLQHVDGTNTIVLRKFVLRPGMRFCMGDTSAIELVSTGDKLRLSLSAAAAVHVHASYMDNDAGVIAPGRQHTAPATVATHDVVGSPGSGIFRRVFQISVTNAHASTPNTVDLIHTDGTTAVVLRRRTLLAGQTIYMGDNTRDTDTETLQGSQLIRGFSAISYNNGTKTSGTFKPDPLNGNIQHYVNGGAHVLSPPDDPCTIILECTNASAGAITTSGFTLVTGDPYSSSGVLKHLLQITKTNGYSHLHVTLLGANPLLTTRQVFLSGSGTYTRPAGCVAIDVEMKGAGGGGGGAGAGQGTGGTGGATTFGSLTANGGTGGSPATNVGPAGGTATGGDFNQTGAPGGGGTGTVGLVYQGGNGGGSGGAGSPQVGPAGGASANSNSGSGGSGAASSGSTGTPAGGAEGGFLRKIITSPASTYSYAIGVGGTAGAGASIGGVGGSGYIIVTEYYN